MTFTWHDHYFAACREFSRQDMPTSCISQAAHIRANQIVLGTFKPDDLEWYGQPLRKVVPKAVAGRGTFDNPRLVTF